MGDGQYKSDKDLIVAGLELVEDLRPHDREAISFSRGNVTFQFNDKGILEVIRIREEGKEPPRSYTTVVRINAG
jgi:hypothetical protein